MEKKEKSEIGISKGLATTVFVILAVISAMVFWKDRGGSEAVAVTTHNFLVEANSGRIGEAEKGLVKVTNDLTAFKESTAERFNDNEKMQIALQKDQQSILRGQEDLKAQQGKFSDLQLKQIQTTADLMAYLKTIESIE